MTLVRIKTFNSRLEAEIAKSYLASKGIESFVHGDDLGGMRPDLALTLGVDLKVAEEDREVALEFLNAVG
jgi:hypothetical protein